MRNALRIAAALGLVSLAAAPVAAQGIKVNLGPMAGGSYATLTGKDADIFVEGTSISKKYRFGFAAGAFAEFEIGKNVAIEPQVIYVQKGAKYDFTDLGTGQSAKVTFKLDYVQVPVLLKAEFRPESGNLTPAVFVGPAVGFKAKCTIKGESAGTTVSQDCPSGSVKGTDFSVVFGVGLEVDKLSFQARYDLGLTKIDDSSPAADVKNGTFLVTVGYGFRLP